MASVALFRVGGAVFTLVLATISTAEPVRVRHTEGLVHGFLTLKTLEGTLLANGDLLQTARGARVTSRLVFRFKDGSLHDETAVFTQRGHFKLLHYHLVQRGQTFERALEMTIDTASGQVDVNYLTEHGEAKH